MKKLFAILAASVLCLSMLTGCGSDTESKKEYTATSSDKKDTENTSDKQEENNSEDLKEGELLSGLHHVEIDIEDYGKISVELDADTAPITVTNFIKLAIRRSRLEIGLNISHTTMKKRISLIHIYEEGKEDFPSFYM